MSCIPVYRTDSYEGMGILNLMTKVLIVLLVILALPTFAYADSEGYYCLGRDYLAYQFGMDVSNRPVRLFVVPVGSVEPASLQLVPFQVHGMQCTDRVVELLGWTALYTVQLDTSRRPASYQTVQLSKPGERPRRFAALIGNLAHLSPAVGSLKPEQVRIGTDNRGDTYSLEMTPRSVNRCTVELTSRIVERDAQGRQSRARVAFQAEIPRGCGE